MKKETVRYSIRLSAELNGALEDICSRRRNLTKKGIIEAALKEYLYPEGTDKRDLEFSRFMDRIERRMKADERYLEIVGETLSLFVRVWLTNTRELPEEQVELARRTGGSRYKKFLELLGKNLQTGRTIFEELPGEVYCTQESFFPAETEEAGDAGFASRIKEGRRPVTRGRGFLWGRRPWDCLEVLR